MRLRKKLCAIGLSCMLGVLCCVPASAAQNSELCYKCGRGDLIEIDYMERREQCVLCSGCGSTSITIHYCKRIHYFQCNYPYCDYKEDYPTDEYIEYADPCPYCILFP